MKTVSLVPLEYEERMIDEDYEENMIGEQENLHFIYFLICST